MILLASIPALMAFAIFFGTVYQRIKARPARKPRPKHRCPTRAERDRTAASSRKWRKLATPLLVGMILLAPAVVGALHLLFSRDDHFIPAELS